jgi:hypothetical protein
LRWSLNQLVQEAELPGERSPVGEFPERAYLRENMEVGMAAHVTKNGSWKVRRIDLGSANGSVEIISSPDGKPLMTESVAAGTTILEVLERAFLKFGVPEQIVTDGSPEFASKSISDILASLGVEHRAEVPRNRSGL